MIENEQLSSLISKNFNLRLVEPHIYSVYSEGENTNTYDRMGSFYDAVLCNPVYNRLVWGYSVTEYVSLTCDVLDTTEGWILDAGCGTLAFTAKTYATYSKQPIVLLDQSIKQLQLAKARMIRLKGSIPENMVFLHGNVLELPFNPEMFQAIVSLNVIHVLEPRDLERMLLELRNALAANCTISFTTLVKNDRLADRYIDLLDKSGEVYARNMAQLLNVFNGLSMPIQYDVKGSLALINYGETASK
jgi:SAM-dependent methyltransferase